MLYLNHTTPPWKNLSLEPNLGQNHNNLEASESVATEFSGIKISPFNSSFQLLSFCSRIPSGSEANSTLFRLDVMSFLFLKYQSGDECLLLWCAPASWEDFSALL